jgi:amino acid adenylation domain-containing protein
MPNDSSSTGAGLSPAKLALLRARLRQSSAANADQIPRQGQTHAPLSFAQQRLWFLDQFDPQSCAYNVARVFRLRGPLRTDALKQALNAIVERHEVLRTTFKQVDGEPVQVIGAPYRVPLQEFDFSSIGAGARDHRAREIAAAEGMRPFDLSGGPMFRATLVKLCQNEHILVLMTHHIASDGWSKGVLFQELATFYNAILKNEPVPLPELPIQYADFAIWQREWVKAQQVRDQLSYWKQQLAGAPELLELPTDYPRSAVQAFAGATECCFLPSELNQGIKSFSQREGTTVFMTLLAAFHILLARYSRQEEVVVGTPIAGRTRPELEPLIGDFVNMLAIRTSVAGEPTFREFLKRVKEIALQAYDNQDLPFEKLVEEMEHGRDLNRAPIFQSIFILETAPPPPPAMQDLEIEILEFDPPTAKNDLILILADDARGLKAKLEYRTDLFTKATAERFLRHYQTLLQSIAADPNQPITRLPILPNDERERVITTWNQTASPEPLGRTIHQFFEAQCVRTPNAIAVQFENSQLTYHELNERANQLAHHLIKLGVRPDSRVGLCVQRSLEMVVALLGIMKAGGAYVPLDPAYPRERLEFMLQDAGAEILLTQSHLLETFTPTARVICIDRDWPAISRQSDVNPHSEVTAANLSYVIYTSGSTGRPKGVQLEHRNVVNFLNSVRRLFALKESDTYLGVASMSFDASVLDFYLPLTVGAKLVIVDAELPRDPGALRQVMTTAGVTAMHATPSMWRSVLETGWRGDKKLKILSGGEALPWDLAKALLPCGSVLWNLYGPTETAVYSAIHRISDSDGTVLVGRPLDNTQIYIVDSHYQPTPIGVPGEICIAGAGVARGYLNRADLTGERFAANPFRPGERIYRTGDLGRFRADGVIECLGRIDNQVKVRGFRIELGEIESVLVQHPGIRQVVADVRAGKSGDKRLVAYIVTENGIPSISDLRSFLAAKLPDYMVPSAFVPLDALPLSPNGKLNRSALPDPGDAHPDVNREFVPPTTPVETTLAAIFSEILDVSRIGLHDDFFELGGHSLLATRVVSRIRDHFQIEVTPRLLFESPTVGELSNRISSLLLQSASSDEMASVLAELGEWEDQ